MQKSLKERMAAGETVVGTVLQYTTTPTVVDVLPETGLDFVMVHMEHNSYDIEDYMPLAYALRNRGIPCIARSHSRDADDISRICDMFPDGVVIPYAEDITELRRLLGAAKYRPLKGEALEHLLATGEWPSEKTREYVTQKCARTLFLPMIESVKAMNNLDAICGMDGVDAVFVGPNDLSVSMGIPEERDNPEFVAALQRVIDVANKYGKPAGAHFSMLSHAQRLIKQGGRFIPYSSDLRLIQRGIPEFLAQLKGPVRAGRETII